MFIHLLSSSACKSVKSLYDKAEYYDKLGDEELAYIYYMRFYKLVYNIRNLANFKADLVRTQSNDINIKPLFWLMVSQIKIILSTVITSII